MLPGYCASSDMKAIRAVSFPSGCGNVAYSVHAYLPYYFTMAEDDKANHNYPSQSGWGEDYTGAINSFFSGLKQLEDEKNIPVVIGEFSASNFNNLSARQAWAKDYITQAKKAGIPCILWDNNVEGGNGGESHGYLNRTRSPKDERVVIITLTEKGRDLRRQALDVPSCIAGRVGLEPAKLVELKGLLEDLLAAFKEA